MPHSCVRPSMVACGAEHLQDVTSDIAELRAIELGMAALWMVAASSPRVIPHEFSPLGLERLEALSASADITIV